ncbi:hypothetical protein L7F22_064537 [Adiantum nelumboides]|nr:hypothetical protein [Adiantum nelumboides]
MLVSFSKTSRNDSNEDTGLGFSVLDIMTGEILDNVWHAKAQGPVNMVQDKSWFAYCYFDSQALTYKLSTLEILETGCEEHQNASGVMNTNALNQSKKGINVLRLEKAVYIPDIKALGLVKGSAKILRQLLFGALDGQITISDMNGVNDTIREGVIFKWMRSFSSSLPQLKLTRAGPVEGLCKIVSVPTMSGSLVFAYGIDMLLVQVVLRHPTPSYLKGYNIHVVLATIGAILFAVSMTRILPRYRYSKKVGNHRDDTQ